MSTEGGAVKATQRSGEVKGAMELDDAVTDETVTGLRGKLITLDEPPPVDAEVFDKHFALLDERDHARSQKRKPDKQRPVSLEETRTDKESGRVRRATGA